jgi:hypothetical protein
LTISVRAPSAVWTTTELIRRSWSELTEPRRWGGVVAVGLPDRHVDGVAADHLAVAGLDVRRPRTELEDVGIVRALGVHGGHEPESALGQGSRLVRDEDVQVTEVLDADQPFHQHLPPSQGTGARGHARLHHRRQQLGGDADGDGEGEQDRVQERPPQQQVDHEDESAQDAGDHQ